MFNNVFPKSYGLWDNVEKHWRAEEVTDDNIIRRMHFACWITKNTHTHPHSKYVILIAFPRQQWLCERASILRSHVYCLSCLSHHTHSSCGLRCSLVTNKQKHGWRTQAREGIQTPGCDDVTRYKQCFDPNSCLPGLKRLEKAVVWKANPLNRQVISSDEMCIAQKVTVRPSH